MGHNPYQPPADIEPVGAVASLSIGWTRAAVWSVIIFGAVSCVAILSGISMSIWEIYGATPEQATAQSRVIRQLACGIVGVLLYWRFAFHAPHSKLINVLVVFTFVQVIDIGFSYFVFKTPASELADLWGTARSLLAALIGLGLVGLGSNNSFKPKPLRGSA